MSSTLVCDVRRRAPIAVVALYGTLDDTSAARAIVTLRDCLADAPTAMILDVEHLLITSDRALRQVLTLLNEVRDWPGTHMGFACPSPATRGLLAGYPAGDLPVLYPALTDAVADALRLPVAQRRSITLQADPDAPATARAFITDTCDNWGIPRATKLASLVASELVTNAVIHARTPSVMGIHLDRGALHVSVRDGDPRPMRRPEPGATGAHTGEHGRGLLILDAMADRWGTLPTATGKVVWATIALPLA